MAAQSTIHEKSPLKAILEARIKEQVSDEQVIIAEKTYIQCQVAAWIVLFDVKSTHLEQVSKIKSETLSIIHDDQWSEQLEILESFFEGLCCYESLSETPLNIDAKVAARLRACCHDKETRRRHADRLLEWAEKAKKTYDEYMRQHENNSFTTESAPNVETSPNVETGSKAASEPEIEPDCSLKTDPAADGKAIPEPTSTTQVEPVSKTGSASSAEPTPKLDEGESTPQPRSPPKTAPASEMEAEKKAEHISQAEAVPDGVWREVMLVTHRHFHYAKTNVSAPPRSAPGVCSKCSRPQRSADERLGRNMRHCMKYHQHN